MWAADNRAYREPYFAAEPMAEHPSPHSHTDDILFDRRIGTAGSVRFLAFSVIVILSFGAGAIASVFVGGPSGPTDLIQAQTHRASPPDASEGNPSRGVFRKNPYFGPLETIVVPAAPAPIPSIRKGEPDNPPMPVPASARQTAPIPQPAPKREATVERSIDTLTAKPEKSVRADMVRPSKTAEPSPRHVEPTKAPKKTATLAAPVEKVDIPAMTEPKAEPVPVLLPPPQILPESSVANVQPPAPEPVNPLPAPQSPAELVPTGIAPMPAIDLQAAAERTAAKAAFDQAQADAAKPPASSGQAATSGNPDQAKTDDAAAQDTTPERPGFFRRALDFVHIGD